MDTMQGQNCLNSSGSVGSDAAAPVGDRSHGLRKWDKDLVIQQQHASLIKQVSDLKGALNRVTVQWGKAVLKVTQFKQLYKAAEGRVGDDDQVLRLSGNDTLNQTYSDALSSQADLRSKMEDYEEQLDKAKKKVEDFAQKWGLGESPPAEGGAFSQV